MVPPGANAHAYEPKPLQMTLLSKAKAYFAIGMEFEGPWLPKFAELSKNMIIVHTDSGIQKLPMTEDSDHDGDHFTNANTPDKNSGVDPHIWLSPKLVKQQALCITKALVTIDPTHTSQYTQNTIQLLVAMDSLEKKILTILPCDSLATGQKKAFLVFHPTWGYFAKDFCLKQVSIEVNGKEPSPQTMKAIIDTAKQYGIKTVFAQPEYSKKTAEVLAQELGGKVVIADALAYDWANNLLTVATQISGK
jgi:zinc transport system substrate-binding protein